MAQFLKYLILFVLIAIVIDLSIYIIRSDIIQLPNYNSDNAIGSIKNNTDSEIMKNILAESTQNNQEHGSSDEGGLDISIGSNMQNTTQSSQQPSSSSQSSSSQTTDICIIHYNMTEHTIIFYYQNEPHSNAMIPIVQNLSSSYNFYQTQDLWNNNFNTCFGLSGITPTFVCAGTKEKISGEISMSALQAFVSRC